MHQKLATPYSVDVPESPLVWIDPSKAMAWAAQTSAWAKVQPVAPEYREYGLGESTGVMVACVSAKGRLRMRLLGSTPVVSV